MAVTNYHTIGGQILSEQTGGVRTEYVQDALGSVIATTDANRNVENTYRYAPYGTQISATGSSPNPMFQWSGTLGYRATRRPHIGAYVRARHYGWEHNGWTSVDPLWLVDRAYAYCLGLPTSKADPAGLSFSVRRIQVGQTFCGNDCIGPEQKQWQFEISGSNANGASYSGWLVQKMVFFFADRCCGIATYGVGPNTCIAPNEWSCTTSGCTATYYEAWYVKNNVALGPPSQGCLDPANWNPSYLALDTWGVFGAKCFTGTRNYHGTLMLLGMDASGAAVPLPPGFSCGGSACAMALPSRYNTWSGPPIWSGSQSGDMTLTYNCCKGSTFPSCVGCPPDPDSGCFGPDCL